MVPQPPKSISILSHIFLTTFHNSDCISLISSISSDRMNLELLATLAIWLMLLPMADICRSNAARFYGGRGRISCPRIAARSNPEIVIPDNDACFFKCSYSFGVIQKSTAFSRFRMVHYSPFRPAAIGGIRGYPLNKFAFGYRELYGNFKLYLVKAFPYNLREGEFHHLWLKTKIWR